jgi:hypothetical protein
MSGRPGGGSSLAFLHREETEQHWSVRRVWVIRGRDDGAAEMEARGHRPTVAGADLAVESPFAVVLAFAALQVKFGHAASAARRLRCSKSCQVIEP